MKYKYIIILNEIIFLLGFQGHANCNNVNINSLETCKLYTLYNILVIFYSTSIIQIWFKLEYYIDNTMHKIHTHTHTHTYINTHI